MSIVVLDELLTVLSFGTPEQQRPDDVIVENVWSSVQNPRNASQRIYRPGNRLPATLELHSLREAGVQTVSDEEFTDALTTLEDRRRQLLGLIESNLGEWPNQTVR